MPSRAVTPDVVRQAALRVLVRQRYGSVPASPMPYVNDPVGFITGRLGERPWSVQCEIAQALVTHRRLAVPSAHSTGKSWLAARLAAFWLETHPAGEAFVVTTATTGAQVRAVLWRELRRAHTKGSLRGQLNQTEWWLNGEMVAVGRKPADYDPTAFQGIHARYLMVVIDEAAGVPEGIFEAAGTLASNEAGRILAIGNPTDPNSHFARVCQPGSGWHVIPVDGLRSPNFTGEPVDDAVRDMLLSHAYEEEVRLEAGVESAVYQSRIRGRFAQDNPSGVVPLSAVRRCQMGADPEPGAEAEIGVDVGAGGDETVARARLGRCVGQMWRARTPEAGQAVEIVLHAIRETGAVRVKVDTIGVGWGIVGRLQELRLAGEHDAEVVPVNVGEASTMPERFPRLRDQIWWEIGRELSLSGGWDLTGLDEATVAQLTAPRYVRDTANRLHVEKKAETRKRLGRSPDCLVAGTLVRTPTGTRPIESFEPGDAVSTPWGTARVLRAHRVAAERLVDVRFNGGSVLSGKPGHAVLVIDKGWVKLRDVTVADALLFDSWSGRILWGVLGQLCGEAAGTGFKRMVQIAATTSRAGGAAADRADRSTSTSTRRRTARLARAWTCITGTAIRSTISPTTSAWSLTPSTCGGTCGGGMPTPSTTPSSGLTSPASATGPVRGTAQTRVGAGTASTHQASGRLSTGPMWSTPSGASSAGTSSSPLSAAPGSARCGAPSGWLSEIAATSRWRLPARIVAWLLSRVATAQSRRVLGVAERSCAGPEAVYDLTLDRHNAYWANGVLVENCADALLLAYFTPQTGGEFVYATDQAFIAPRGPARGQW